MHRVNLILFFIAGALTLVCAGCGDSPGMTPAQEEAVRHPQADPNYKGPSPEAQAKMQQSIADYKQKHANDKVEFNTGR